MWTQRLIRYVRSIVYVGNPSSEIVNYSSSYSSKLSLLFTCSEALVETCSSAEIKEQKRVLRDSSADLRDGSCPSHLWAAVLSLWSFCSFFSHDEQVRLVYYISLSNCVKLLISTKKFANFLPYRLSILFWPHPWYGTVHQESKSWQIENLDGLLELILKPIKYRFCSVSDYCSLRPTESTSVVSAKKWKSEKMYSKSTWNRPEHSFIYSFKYSSILYKGTCTVPEIIKNESSTGLFQSFRTQSLESSYYTLYSSKSGELSNTTDCTITI